MVIERRLGGQGGGEARVGDGGRRSGCAREKGEGSGFGECGAAVSVDTHFESSNADGNEVQMLSLRVGLAQTASAVAELVRRRSPAGLPASDVPPLPSLSLP